MFAVVTRRTERRINDPNGRRQLRSWIVLVFVGAILLEGCTSLPSLEGRSVSTVLTDTQDTRLGKAIVPMVASHPGKSGIYPLADARNAFTTRMLLASAAQRTLDVQYYIWRNDMTGGLLFDALRKAAQRGVRVRLLLDDNNTAGLDPVLAELDAHPNIEVRLFNPVVTRSFRWFNYLTDFSRLNRRMHNKSFTADNQATIIGGRNIGDAYFDATDDMLFADLDVVAVGPAVTAVSTDFDRYWASSSSYPLQRLLQPEGQQTTRAASFSEDNPSAQAYMQAVRGSSFLRELLDRQLPLEWANTQMVSDNPAKALGKAPSTEQLPDLLKRAIGRPVAEVDLVSPYFVPTAAGVATFSAMAQRGVKIRVLTNALEATDVAAVHAGYVKRRKALLEAGITIYELKRVARGPGTRKEATLLRSSSGSSLHAKTFSVDRSRVFIGSFNFDPRSAKLNTEMGFVIENAALAQQITDVFDHGVPDDAYEVRLASDGSLYWIERREGTIVRHDVEPGTGFWQRTGVFLMSLLPIEDLL